MPGVRSDVRHVLTFTIHEKEPLECNNLESLTSSHPPSFYHFAICTDQGVKVYKGYIDECQSAISKSDIVRNLNFRS